MRETKLWYTQPPTEYIAGLPIGTGRLAAMVMGEPETERVALNHEWLWRGACRNRETEKRSHLLAKVRKLLLAGRYEEGTQKGNEAFAGGGGMIKDPKYVDPYQPAGDLHFRLDHGAVENYRRELDLTRALVTVEYDAASVHYRREYLADMANDLLLVRITATQPFGGEFWLSRIEDPGCFLHQDVSGQTLVMNGQFEGGIGFRVEAGVALQSGTVKRRDGRLVVRKATEVLVIVNIGTSAKGQAPARECAAAVLPHTDWRRLLARHGRAYRRLYSGLRLEVEGATPRRPTNERLAAAREGRPDPGLPLLYFNYGRYLLVAGTANAELPPNLQGKWNEELAPPWDADYHHDVNLQMNYWPAEPGHLQYTTEALFQHIERFVPHARKAARDVYGCKGVWFPIQTDAWGRCTPESFGWAVWISAAPWLAQHMWWHYEYGGDLDFLRQRAYPFFKEIAAFYESYLVEDKHGQLQIVPSQSPENRFVGGGPLPVTLCVSATMDVSLARDLLNHAVQAAKLLKVDPDKRRQWSDMLRRLPPLSIGKHGQLQEWLEDFDEIEPGHRHFSHLFALYPGDELDPDRTPALWKAARASLERRLAHEGGHTGWSRCWTACLFARLGDGAAAWDHFMHLILDFATDSLLDLHPPRIFQIEGNLGGVAAILEMLLQSYHGELHFLPALPTAWATGKIVGLRARGGYSVDQEWADGLLKRATVTASQDGVCTILHGTRRYRVTDSAGKKIVTRAKGHRLRFDTVAGRRYLIRPDAAGHT